jgi:hypothetical protein
MNHINIPTYKLSIIIPHKSGNTIIYSTLADILQLYLIEFNLTPNRDEMEENCILFVRNPVDRFFSSYNWYVKIKKQFDEGLLNMMPNNQLSLIKESLKVFESLEIDSLSKFIEKYKNFINNSNDTHYLPQSSSFLRRDTDKGVMSNLSLNLRNEYDTRFEKHNYKFFRVEDINEIIKLNKSLLIKNGLTSLSLSKNDVVNNIELKTFPFLKDFPKRASYLFMVFNTYFNDFLSENHHSKTPNYYYDEITVDEYLTVYEMFRKECIFFGYNDEPNLKNLEFKKSKELVKFKKTVI